MAASVSVSGTVDGVDAFLVSDGESFLEVGPDFSQIPNRPPLDDVVIVEIFAGDLIVFLEGDC